MSIIIEKIKCFFGYHDIERLPSPPGIAGGVFGPSRCRRAWCNYQQAGFPLPRVPMPSVEETAAEQPEADQKDSLVCLVPAVCLCCGASYQGGHELPGQPMKIGLRIFYECGCTISIKNNSPDSCLILCKNCLNEK
jgi:hypothetical protein